MAAPGLVSLRLSSYHIAAGVAARHGGTGYGYGRGAGGFYWRILGGGTRHGDPRSSSPAPLIAASSVVPCARVMHGGNTEEFEADEARHVYVGSLNFWRSEAEVGDALREVLFGGGNNAEGGPLDRDSLLAVAVPGWAEGETRKSRDAVGRCQVEFDSPSS